jgi:protein O-mannosyl-transferase
MSRRSRSRIPRGAGLSARPGLIARQSGKVPPPDGQPRNRWLSLAICLFLALAVWAVFGQTLHHEFVNYDDSLYVTQVAQVQTGLSWEGLKWAFTSLRAGSWHPLTWLSHMTDCQLFGLRAWGHHLSSLLLHLSNTVLLFLVLQRMTRARWRSAVAAALFALHPLHVEPVAWVSGRKDLLAAFFCFLMLWAYARFVEESAISSQGAVVARRTPRTSLWYCLTLLFFALGLMSKPMLVTLPFVLLLLDYWPLRRLQSPAAGLISAPPPERGDSCPQQAPQGNALGRVPTQLYSSNVAADRNVRAPTLWQRRDTAPATHGPSLVRNLLPLLREKVPFFVLAAACSVLTYIGQAQMGALPLGSGPPPGTRAANALLSYAWYFAKTLWPNHLAGFYPYPKSFSSWEVAAALLLLAGATVLALRWRRQRPYVFVGWLWYVVTLLPVIGVIQVGEHARADRYAYLPQIGLYFLAVWGAVEFCGAWRWHRVVVGSAAAAIFAGLLACAYVQTAYWKDSVSLWTHTLACTPASSFAHYDLAGALAAQGKWDEAISHYERALQLEPDDAVAHTDLANAFAAQGRLAEAIPQYERALQLKPDDAITHLDLGNALAAQEQLPEAIGHYERALQLDPKDAEAHNNLGIALAREGKLAEAILQYDRALQLKPNVAAAHNNLALALAEQGNLNEAIQHFQQALNLATAQNKASLAQAIRSRLKSYQSGLPQPQTR